MSSSDLIGLGILALISTAFYLFRSRPVVFNLFYILAAAAFAILAEFPLVEKILVASGILLYGFGLAITQVMLRRSVSLLLLQRLRDGMTAASVEEEIASRIEDAQKFGLIRKEADSLELSAFGKFGAQVIKICYFLTRQYR